MRDYQQLEFWQRSHKLTLQIYKITQTFPKEETFNLTSQMRSRLLLYQQILQKAVEEILLLN